MTLICITHSLEHGYRCTIRGQHLSTCDGQNNRGGECTGCLPRPAEVGILCRNCNDKYTAALSMAVDLITHLRSIERGPQSIDGVRSGALVQPSYPASWQEADNLWRHLAGIIVASAMDRGEDDPAFPYWTAPGVGFSFSASLDRVAEAVRWAVAELSVKHTDVVSRTGGAEAAVGFYRAVQTALARFPLEEKSRPVKYIKCRNCQQKTLRWLPPLEYMDAIVIQCQNLTCGEYYDPAMAEWDMRVLRQEIEEAAARAAEAEAVA